jgi:hypothetical protein
MPITYKLVGNVNSKVLEIKRDIIGLVKLSHMVSMFSAYGMSSENFEHIRFVAESETLKDDSKSFQVSNDNNIIVFVFTANKEVKGKLVEIFLKNATNMEDVPETKVSETSTRPLIGTVVDSNTLNRSTRDNGPVDPEIAKPVVDTVEEEEKNPELTPEIIHSINQKTAKLFENKDFKHLVRIYYTNPETIKTFLNFVSHGDIAKMTIPTITEDKDYEMEISMLKSLGISESDEVIGQVLKAFNGHLNLALRVLLCRKAVNFTA